MERACHIVMLSPVNLYHSGLKNKSIKLKFNLKQNNWFEDRHD